MINYLFLVCPDSYRFCIQLLCMRLSYDNTAPAVARQPAERFEATAAANFERPRRWRESDRQRPMVGRLAIRTNG